VFKKPTIYGTFLAALFMATMLNGFTLMTVSYYYMDFIIGIILVAALCLSSDIFFKKKTGKRSMDVPDSTVEVAP